MGRWECGLESMWILSIIQLNKITLGTCESHTKTAIFFHECTYTFKTAMLCPTLIFTSLANPFTYIPTEHASPSLKYPGILCRGLHRGANLESLLIAFLTPIWHFLHPKPKFQRKEKLLHVRLCTLWYSFQGHALITSFFVLQRYTQSAYMSYEVCSFHRI